MSVGITAFVMDIWSDRSAPYIQMMSTSMLIGCASCPQIAKPFLLTEGGTVSSEPMAREMTAVDLFSNDSVRLLAEHTVGYLASTPGPPASTLGYLTLTMGYQRNISPPSVNYSQQSHIEYAFIIVGCFLLVGAVLHFIHFSTSHCTFHHIQKHKIMTGGTQDGESQQMPLLLKNLHNDCGLEFLP